MERLYSDALNLLPDIHEKTVYDLYCGTGTITQLMALKAKKVYGVEIVEDSVEAARHNAELNGITNCEFLCGDVRKKLDELTEKPDMIVVDPPRAGHARQSGAHAVPVRHPGNPVHLLQPENHVHESGTLQNERLRTRIHEILRQLPDDKARGDMLSPAKTSVSEV